MSDIKRIGYTIEHYLNVDNGRLQQHIASHLNNPTIEEVDEAVDFVRSYLKLVEPALQHLYIAAQNVLKLRIIQPLIDDCIEYFRRSNDHINEHQYGLYGLIDDAYRTMTIISTVQQTISDIQLPFDTEQLKSLNQSLKVLIPKDIINKIDTEILKIQSELLISEIQNSTNLQQQKIQSQEVTFTNKKLNFPFAAFPILTDLSDYQGKKGIYAYTRIVEQNGQFTHHILYIGRINDISLINQSADKALMDKTQNPTHICIYTYSQDDATIKEWTTSLILQYHPIFNLKNPNYRPKPTQQRQQQQQTQSYSYQSNRPQTRSCGYCHGSGQTTCSSCGGRGGRYQSRVDYDWEGRPNYRDEWINCYACNGGYSACVSCGGTGEVYL